MQHEERSDAPADLPASPERRLHGVAWQSLQRAIRNSVFSPAWLLAPWNSPAVGYGAALLLPVALVCLTWFLLHFFPRFSLPGIPPLLATLVVALLWGSGPGLLATLMGSVELASRQAGKILAQQERLPADVAPLGSKLLGHLDRTERQIRMQNRLISDLLDVARIHANRLELEPELCDLQALVRETVEDQQYITPARTITLSSSVTGEVLVMADKDRVRQVISDYLSNALKYSEPHKPVRVRLELSGKLARVSVRDDGPGLSSEQQQRIWERFYRVPEVEVKSGSGVGLGLGLHISRMIIERLGGQVGVESAQGKGCTFWLALPLVQADEGE